VRKLFIFVNIFLIGGLVAGSVFAAADVPLQTDQDCVTYNLIRPANVAETCNNICQVTCLNSVAIGGGKSHCSPGTTDNCNGTIPTECALSSIKDFFTFAGVVIPADKVVQYFSRVLLMGAYSLAALLSIVYGVYGVYKRSFSEGNAEKVEESMKIFKNAIIGIIIVFMSVVVVQIGSTFLGVTSNPFDFSLVPVGTKGTCVTSGPTPTP
jgi:hypothetical protein